jgi:hypothetical protein
MGEPDPGMDPDQLKGPGGLTLRQVHQQVRKSVERDLEAQQTTPQRGLLMKLIDRLRPLFTGRKR